MLFSGFAQAEISGQGKIYYAVDGDTFDIQVKDFEVIKSLYHNNYVGKEHISVKNRTFRVRLANVNTEESSHKDVSRNTKYGKETANVVSKKFSYQQVNFTCYKKGNYDRAICDLETSEGDIGVWLIENNYSDYVSQYGKHPKQHSEYSLAQKNRSSREIYSNNPSNFDKIKNFRKPSKIKIAKKAWNYFKDHKGLKPKVSEKIQEINMQDVINQLSSLKNTAGKADMLTQEQANQLSYLKNLTY